MHKHIKLITLAATLAAPALASVGCATTDSTKPLNILYVCAEDMGKEIGPYGDRTVPTPALDQLASMGTTFEHAYATAATCSTSRASMMTGLYPHQHGQLSLMGRGYRIREGIPNIVDDLKEAGYFTITSYKIHYEPEPKFDFFYKGKDGGPWSNPSQYVPYLNEALDAANKAEKPFFAVINTFDTHGIDKAPAAKIQQLFHDQVHGEPENPITWQEVTVPTYLAPEDPSQASENMLRNVAAYYNAIQRVDGTLAVCLQILEERGLLENTLIIFSSDHGPNFPRGKRFAYELATNVPLIVSHPDNRSQGAQRSAALISQVDLLPTFREVANMPPVAKLPGHSLLPLAADPTLTRRNYVSAEYFSHWGPYNFYPTYTIRDERYKLIYNVDTSLHRPIHEYRGIPFLNNPGAHSDKRMAELMRFTAKPPSYELYDLKNDPWELDNLSGQADHANTLAHLKTALQQWRQATNDPFIEEITMRAFIKHNQDDMARISQLSPEEREKAEPLPFTY